MRGTHALASEEIPARRTWAGACPDQRLPSTDRGVETTCKLSLPDEPLEFAVHELTGTTRMTLDEVLGTVSDFGINFEQEDRGNRLYKQAWTGEHGISVQTENKMGSDEVYVRLPGEACEHLGLVKLLSLGTLLNLNVTRLDGAIDHCPYTPRELRDAHEAGLTRTHAKVSQSITSSTGETFYLGSPSSDVRLRCYDRRGFTRSELQLRRGHAQNFFDGLLARDESELPELFLGVLRNFVDFVEPSEDSNRSRWDLLPWWSAFVNDFRRVRLAPVRVVASPEKYLIQARKYGAMFHTYVSLLASHGRSEASVLSELHQHGSSLLKPRHRLLLARGFTPFATLA